MISRRSLLAALPLSFIPKPKPTPKPKGKAPMVWSNQAPESLVFPPGATTGARIVIDQNGIVIYDSNNHPIFVAASAGIVPGNDFTDNPIVFGGQSGTFASQVWKGSNGDSLFEIFAPSGPENVLQIGSLQRSSVTRIGGANDGLEISTVPFTAGLGNKWKFGDTGLKHNYYYEEFALAGNTLATGVITALTGMTATKQLNDYGTSALDTTTGIWTAPEDGVYNIDLSLTYTALYGAAGASRLIFSGIKQDQREVSNGNVPFHTMTARKFIAKNTTFTIQALQTSGANKTISVIGPNYFSAYLEQ